MIDKANTVFPREIQKIFYKSRGFSLLELIAAIVVLSFALGGVVMTFNVAVKNSADPVLYKQALSVAEEKIAECKMLSFEDAKDNCKGIKLDAYANNTPIEGVKVEITATPNNNICSKDDNKCYEGLEIKVVATPNDNSKYSVILQSYRTNWNKNK